MATTAATHILLDARPPAARVTLNRPERRNALSLALMEELTATLLAASATPGIRALSFRPAQLSALRGVEPHRTFG